MHCPNNSSFSIKNLLSLLSYLSESFISRTYIYTYILELLHKNIINRKAFLKKKKARKLKKKNKFARNKIVFKFYDVIGITFNPAITLLYENTR